MGTFKLGPCFHENHNNYSLMSCLKFINVFVGVFVTLTGAILVGRKPCSIQSSLPDTPSYLTPEPPCKMWQQSTFMRQGCLWQPFCWSSFYCSEASVEWQAPSNRNPTHTVCCFMPSSVWSAPSGSWPSPSLHWRALTPISAGVAIQWITLKI